MDRSISDLERAIESCDRGESGFSCDSVDGRFAVQLWGLLPEQWAGNLALHCFASSLSIEAADALRIEGDRWAAAFVLRPGMEGQPIGGRDFLAMARHAPRFVPTLPPVRAKIVASPARDGSAFVRVNGPDSIGLLAEVIRRFSAFALYPRRFKLRTENELVNDWFWLEPTTQPVDARAPKRLGDAAQRGRGAHAEAP